MNHTSFNSIILKAGTTTAQTLTEQLREKAVSQGWPSEVAAGISINFADERFSVDIDPKVKKTADTLEYGNEKLEPNPVIRTFTLRSHTASEEFAENFIKESGWRP